MPGRAAPSSTSLAACTFSRSAPGSASTWGIARWNPVRVGRDPVESTTASAPKFRMPSAVISRPSSTRTCSFSSCVRYQPKSSPISSRSGCAAARRNCPPRVRRLFPPASHGGRARPRCARSPARGRPAAHHQHVARLGRRRRGVAVPRVLAADGRIDEAGDVVVPHAPPDAELVAGDARPDVLRTAPRAPCWRGADRRSAPARWRRDRRARSRWPPSARSGVLTLASAVTSACFTTCLMAAASSVPKGVAWWKPGTMVVNLLM